MVDQSSESVERTWLDEPSVREAIERQGGGPSTTSAERGPAERGGLAASVLEARHSPPRRTFAQARHEAYLIGVGACWAGGILARSVPVAIVVGLSIMAVALALFSLGVWVTSRRRG